MARQQEAAAARSVVAMATEIHQVDRLAGEHPDRTVVSLYQTAAAARVALERMLTSPEVR